MAVDQSQPLRSWLISDVAPRQFPIYPWPYGGLLQLFFDGALAGLVAAAGLRHRRAPAARMETRPTHIVCHLDNPGIFTKQTAWPIRHHLGNVLAFIRAKWE
jgi:hypothetical protein